MAKTVHAFCKICADNVRCTEQVEGGLRRVVCSNCHFVVSEKRVTAKRAPAAPRRATLGRVFAAEATQPVRELLESALQVGGIAHEIRTRGSGQDLLVEYIRSLDTGTPVDLVILDVDLPRLSGVQTALAMRAVEAEMGARRVPILFVTSQPASTQLTRAMEHLSPARHLLEDLGGALPGLPERLGEAIGDWRPVVS